MNDKKLLAVCVMTYRHPDTLKEVLPEWLTLVNELDFDIYYMDSSPESESRQIIDEYEKKNPRIHYLRISPDFFGKGLLPYHKDFLPQRYKYFWPIKDRSVPTPELMMRIFVNLINGCDAVEISAKHPNEVFAPLRYKSVYTDQVDLYRDLAWSAIDMQTTIYSYDTVFADYNEEHMRKMYPELGFIHTMGFFHYLAQLDSVTVPFIYAGERKCSILSTNTPSGWRLNNTGLGMFGCDWPKTNLALPEIYQPYRKEAVKAETNLPVLFGSVDGMLSLNFYDESNRKYVNQMLPDWSDYSDVPVDVAVAIRDRDWQKVYDWFCDTLEKYVQAEQTDKAAMLCSGTRFFVREYTDFCSIPERKQLFDSLVDLYDNAQG